MRTITMAPDQQCRATHLSPSSSADNFKYMGYDILLSAALTIGENLGQQFPIVYLHSENLGEALQVVLPVVKILYTTRIQNGLGKGKWYME